MKLPTALLVAIGLTAACERQTTIPELISDAGAPEFWQAGLGAEVARDLAALRRATASFHDSDAAAEAGWSTAITGCMSGGSAGAMGIHFGNLALIDSVAEVDRPELLLYEPTRKGGLRLVGVEYIIPYTHHSREAAPPVLFGHEFLQVDAFELWGLHAWVWAENPDGMFAAWNPRVSCDFAPVPSVAGHH